MFLREYVTNNTTVTEPAPYEIYHAQPGEEVFCPKCGSTTIFYTTEEYEDFKAEAHACSKCDQSFSVEFYLGQLDEEDLDPRQSPLDFAIVDGKLQISIGLDLLMDDVILPSMETWSAESWLPEVIDEKTCLSIPYPHVTTVRGLDETKFFHALLGFLKKLDAQHEGVKHDLHHVTEQLLDHYDSSINSSPDIGLEYILVPDNPDA